MSGAGRFAPSPSGDLHVGNLRTAVLAWLLARQSGRAFLLRIEDLDRVQPGAEARQLDDLAALGIGFDASPVRQSDRRDAYAETIDTLRSAGLVYECFCTRREIQEAASAPHAPPGAYPGTCRNLTDAGRAERRRDGRRAALRLRSDTPSFEVTDALMGKYTGPVDDLVLQRTDGVPAYNLAVVVDDGFQRVDQVVRADDLLTSAPRQAYLAQLLDIPVPEYVHVPLALGPTGARLAKRDGAVTLRDRLEAGATTADVLAEILASIGAPGCTDPAELLETWTLSALPREPWHVLGN
ncbi:MAG: tRNA glutamyl-Q(34) synthetase GluQRS [Rhodococcus sp. (in: high G+C Gram-positive bacteria)]